LCNHLTLRLISFCHWLRGFAHLNRVNVSACEPGILLQIQAQPVMQDAK